MLSELKMAGLSPRIEVLAHGLPDAATALRIEAAAIDLLGVEDLANLVRGHYTKFGRMPLEDVVALYTKRRAKIREPSLLIRLNRLYRYGMSPFELYDATRSAWVVGAEEGGSGVGVRGVRRSSSRGIPGRGLASGGNYVQHSDSGQECGACQAVGVRRCHRRRRRTGPVSHIAL